MIAATLLLLAQLTSIPAPPGAGSLAPSLYATKHDVILSWLEDNTLRFSRYDGTKWSAPVNVVKRDDLFVNWADFPSVIEDAKGVLFAQWLQKSGPGYSYDSWMATSSDGGKSWSKPFLLNRDGKKNEHGFVSLVPLAKGGVAATWLDSRNEPEGATAGDMSLRYATVSARGVVANEVELDSRACDCCTTAMAMTATGPLIVYRDRSDDEIRDISYVRPGAKPRTVHADGWKIAGCPVNGPQVDAIGKTAAVTWFTSANDQPRVYVAFSEDFEHPIRVDEGKPVGRVDVVLLDPNTALVSWLEEKEVRARTVTRNGTLGTSAKIADASPGRASGFPRIARLGRDVYFAWTQMDGTAKQVQLARMPF